jgi:hypothetical protein
MSRYGSILLALSLLLPACAPRVIVATGTTLGIRATPGDGQTRPPQVVLGYKRAEAALIPVEGGGAQTNGDEMKTDAASIVASFYLKSEWTAGTEIRSFIGSGFAARSIVGDSWFSYAFANAALSNLPSHIVDRRERLAAQLRALNRNESSAERVLSLAQLSKKTNRTATESLRVYILDATTDADLRKLETAFAAVPTP